MNSMLTNLLPPERENALSREYRLRLSVVAVWFVTALVVAAMALLLPTYVFLSENVHTKQAQLTSIESALSSNDEAAFTARLDALNTSAGVLSALANAPSASAMLRAVLAVSRPGIVVSELGYTPAKGANAGTVAITGSASTRDSLRAYQLALSAAPFAHAVNLPVSSYAKDADIPFTITVTLTP